MNMPVNPDAEKPRRLKKLRIAVSAVFVLLALAFVVLWVRSYKTADRLHGRFWDRQSFLLGSKEGRLAAVAFRWHGASTWPWQLLSYPVSDELAFPVGPVQQYEAILGFGWLTNPLYMVMRSTQTMPNGMNVTVFGTARATLRGAGPIIPFWFLVPLMAMMAAIPWLPFWSRFRFRFRLRTLFIVMTVVAVLLGLGVWLVRG